MWMVISETATEGERAAWGPYQDPDQAGELLAALGDGYYIQPLRPVPSAAEIAAMRDVVIASPWE